MDGTLDLEMDGKRYFYKMNVIPQLHKFLVGQGGSVKQQLEQNSGARIEIPGKQSKSEIVTISADKQQPIYSAKAQIELLLEKEELKLRPTHFLTIPLNFPAVQDRYMKFKNAVGEKRYDGIGDDIFMKVARLHFTLCCLKLHTPKQKEAAITSFERGLEKVKEAIKDPVNFDLRGLYIMNDDPKSVNVIYTTDTNPKISETVNRICDIFFEEFRQAGIITNKDLHRQRALDTSGVSADIKLHCTLLNTKYRDTSQSDVHMEGEEAENAQASGGSRRKVDAAQMIEDFANFSFGQFKAGNIALCNIMDFGNDGFYNPLSTGMLF